MLSILCVRLTIKVKVGIPESFKVGWYPPKKLGQVTLSPPPHGSRAVGFQIRRKWIFTSIERALHVSTPYGFLHTLNNHSLKSRYIFQRPLFTEFKEKCFSIFERSDLNRIRKETIKGPLSYLLRPLLGKSPQAVTWHNDAKMWWHLDSGPQVNCRFWLWRHSLIYRFSQG